PWVNMDWSSLTETDQQNEFINFIKKDRDQGFNMEQAPLMRCAQIKLGSESYQFVWSFHHILMDGWSYPIIQKEVFSYYESFVKNNEISLPTPLLYKHFIVWQNQQDKVKAENFWRKELEGFNSPTSLKDIYKLRNTNENLPEEINDLGINLSKELSLKLQNLAKQNQLTLNTIIQGVWSIILSTYTGERDVLFGGVVSGRTPNLKGVGSMVGMFINTLPVRINVDKEKEIIAWLKQLQLNHIERDQFSYSSLVDIMELSSVPKGTPLFENIIVFENYPLDESLSEGIAGITIKNLRAFERTNFPLTILVAPGSELTIHISYETDKFDKTFIEQILKNFETLLENFSNKPFGTISDLSIITDEEKNKVLSDWNNTNKEFPSEKCVQEFFEEQLLKIPNSVAVEFGNIKLTYQELNMRANQVANYLIKFGAGPDVIIGICIERSLEMIIGLLGILKSGSAYVPLDSAYPIDRLSFMIEDSGIPILLTKKNVIEKLPRTKAKVVLIDEEEKEIFKESVENPVKKINSSNLAYVLYTSGSTGRPKGVLMMHKALSNLLHWQVEGQKFGKGFRVLQFTTLSFDVSFQEIFSTWYSGGTLVMMTDEERQDLPTILKKINSEKIERIYLPFIALQEIAEIYSDSGYKTLDLREVYTAGEQLQITPAIINLFKSLKDFIFANQYGPSEAHVVTSYTLNDKPESWVKLPPIGTPVYNTQMYILDQFLKPVPPGVSGDLYIGGVQLVRGYHNRPELTEEKFKDNPFDKLKSKKLYKTGDIARYLQDGNIEYLGRADNQIKLRGFRIELGEIESVLTEYPGLKNVAVVTREFSDGDKRLVAYIVLSGENEIETSELRKYLKSKLPDYMVPGDFMTLKEMPLTPSGKVDQKALPLPGNIRETDSNKYSEPKDELELQLVKIWEKVLGVKPIGITDNFFDLGGHSLLALRLFGYIEKLTGKKLALSTLFNYPTIEELAKIIRNEGWTKPWKSLVAVKPGGSRIPFFCVPPAAGTALHFQDMIKYVNKDQPFYVLESVGLDGKESPHTDLIEMASFYVKEIQTLQPEGPYLIGGRCFGGRVVFEMAQQLMKSGHKVALVAIFDTWPPFIAPPPNYVPPKRDPQHFLKSIARHIQDGDLWTVIRNYSSNKYIKTKWRIQNKIEYTFSSKRKKLFKKIMLQHFHAQDRYVAKKYPGKITLIECATFKREYREGWRNLAEGGFETYVVPDTNHKTIVKEPKLRDFAEKLNFVLEKTQNELKEMPSKNGVNSLIKKTATLEV
ncbi:MAG: amino acid adenylation domain-containing protein, partial [Ignavibacteria bacterium]